MPVSGAAGHGGPAAGLPALKGVQPTAVSCPSSCLQDILRLAQLSPWLLASEGSADTRAAPTLIPRPTHPSRIVFLSLAASLTWRTPGSIRFLQLL